MSAASGARRGRPRLPPDRKRIVSVRLSLTLTEWAALWEAFREKADANDGIADFARYVLFEALYQFTGNPDARGLSNIACVGQRNDFRIRTAEAVLQQELADLWSELPRCEAEQTLTLAVELLDLEPRSAWQASDRRTRLVVSIASALHRLEATRPRTAAIEDVRVVLGALPGHPWQPAA